MGCKKDEPAEKNSQITTASNSSQFYLNVIYNGVTYSSTASSNNLILSNPPYFNSLQYDVVFAAYDTCVDPWWGSTSLGSSSCLLGGGVTFGVGSSSFYVALPSSALYQTGVYSSGWWETFRLRFSKEFEFNLETTSSFGLSPCSTSVTIVNCNNVYVEGSFYSEVRELPVPTKKLISGTFKLPRCYNPDTPHIYLTYDSTYNVSNTTASLSAKVIDNGSGKSILSRGFIYKVANSNPFFALGDPGVNAIYCNSGFGNFSTSLSGLLPNSRYFVKAFAITSTDTIYPMKTINDRGTSNLSDGTILTLP